MRDCFIAPVEKAGGGGKGRTFAATCLATVECDRIWKSGGGASKRPIWAMFAGSENELRPFMANVVAGRRVEFEGDKSRDQQLEFLRSVGFRVTWQKEPEGSVVTVFLPELFELDPGMVDPDGAAFVCMPSRAWVEAQKIDAAPIIEHALKFELWEASSNQKKLLARNFDSREEYREALIEQKKEQAKQDELLASLVPVSFLFASYLDRRTRFPLYADGRFYLQLMLACLKQGLASWPDDGRYRGYGERGPFGHNLKEFKAAGLEDVGLVQPIAFKASHDEIGAILDEQVSLFIEAVENKPVKRQLVREARKET